MSFWLEGCCGECEGWARNSVNHTSWVDVVTQTDRPKSVRNRTFGGFFGLSLCLFDISVDVVALIIGLSRPLPFLLQAIMGIVLNIFFSFAEFILTCYKGNWLEHFLFFCRAYTYRLKGELTWTFSFLLPGLYLQAIMGIDLNIFFYFAGFILTDYNGNCLEHFLFYS